VRSRFLDTHCHLDECRDPDGSVRHADQAGIVILAVTESPDGYQRMKTAFGGRSHVRIALGLHPMAMPALGRRAVEQFLRILPDADYVGEVGLDFSRTDPGMRRQQVRVFEEILAAPSARSSLWSVHSRRAGAEVIERLEGARVPAILHWFTGTKAEVERASASGLFFSVNAAMVGSARGRSLIEAMPVDRVLTETDAPYVETANGRRDPSDVIGVVDALARLWRVTPDDARDKVFANMARAFALRKARPNRNGAGSELGAPHTGTNEVTSRSFSADLDG
jgi:TatD DNase family protein